MLPYPNFEYPANVQAQEIVRYCIGESEQPYDHSWIKGHILLELPCEDGLILIVYKPSECNDQ